MRAPSLKTILAMGLLAISLTLASPLAHALGGTDSGGGAGCKDGTSLKTLYYCGAYKGPAPAPVTAPPKPLSVDGSSENPKEVTALLNFIAKLRHLKPETRKELARAIKPSFRRKYFTAATAPALTAPIVERIKEEFHGATGIDPTQLSLYAVTDTAAKVSNFPEDAQITYLLPGFSTLATPEQRMVALFHESLWVWQPDSDYKTIVAREMAFEALVAQPNNTARLLDFVRKMENDEITTGYMSLVMKYDLEAGNLKGFASKDGRFSHVALLGAQNIQCLNRATQKSMEGYNIFDGKKVNEDLKDLIDQCVTGVENQLDNLRRAYPKSLLLTVAGSPPAKALLENARQSVDDEAASPAGPVNTLLCYVAGLGENSKCATARDLNDYYIAEGAEFLQYALMKPSGSRGKFCPIDGMAYFREAPVSLQLQTNPDAAAHGALTPAAKPASFIPAPYHCTGEEPRRPTLFGIPL